MDVVFVPDSELMLPGRGGAADPLSHVRSAVLDELTSVLQETDVRTVVVLYCASSPFGTPLPGAEVGEELLAAAGFTGDVAFYQCRWDGDADDSSPVSEIVDDVSAGDQGHAAVLLLGTGSAAREDDSPIPYHPESRALDDALRQILKRGSLHDVKTVGADLPRAVGATLIPTLARLNAVGVSNVRARSVCSFDDLGVRYFVGTWHCDVVTR